MGKNDDAKKELKDAREALNRLPKTGDETDEYRKVNNRVIKAEQALPWRKR